MRIVISVLALALAASPAAAMQDAVPAEPESITAEQFEASLHYRHGQVELPGGIATMDLPDGFKYLEPDDAEQVIEKAWGNPDGSGTLGMLFPESQGVTDSTAWGVVITYENDGHVSDSDANEIDYDALMEQMRESTQDANAERRKLGFAAVQLVGWGEPPRYDKDSHKLYWAKQLKFGDAGVDTLNYNIRVLGREGVLVLNAVATIDQLADIKPQMNEVVGFTDFIAGNRYQDYQEGVDKTAAYGLSALIAGGVAAKTGLLAKLLALLIAAKKLVLLAIVGAGAAIGKWFKGKRDISGRKV
jgi:uncharacterized membrane-anchored protein